MGEVKPNRPPAAPTFAAWRRRADKARKAELPRLVAEFAETVRAVGTPLVDEQYVDFVHFDSNARSVAVAGEFNQWNPLGAPMQRVRDTAVFHHRIELPGSARIEYKIVVDGDWRLDPFCAESVDNGLGSRNSVFVVGDAGEPPEAEVRPGVPRGRIDDHAVKSHILRGARRVHVYVPADLAPTARVPALYVHDGGEYLERAHLAIVLDNLIYQQLIPPIAAVAIDPVDRMREYRISEDYARFVESDLVPFVDQRYPTRPDRDSRAVMGASLGGLISAYLALTRPALFGRFAGQSSAFFLEEGVILAQAREVGQTFVAYFDVGCYEPQFIPAHHRLAETLHAKGSRCFVQEVPAGHNWTSWRRRLKDLLTFLWSE
jgi:enterochelin esterase-like enzyme